MVIKNRIKESFIVTILLVSYLILSSEVNAQDGIVKTYYEGRKISSELSFINDQYDGTSYWYYKNGNLKEERSFSSGRLHGWTRKYYNSGIPESESQIVDGVLDGVTNFYYQNGGLKESRTYDQGNLKRRSYVGHDSTFMAPVTMINGGRILTRRNGSLDESLCDLEICPEPIGGFEILQEKLIYQFPIGLIKRTSAK